MLNSYAFASFRIKIKSLDSTINKRKISAYPIQAEKMIFLSKNHKNTAFFNLKCAILNRYAYESRNIEMINSEVTKNKSKFFQIPDVV